MKNYLTRFINKVCKTCLVFLFLMFSSSAFFLQACNAGSERNVKLGGKDQPDSKDGVPSEIKDSSNSGMSDKNKNEFPTSSEMDSRSENKKGDHSRSSTQKTGKKMNPEIVKSHTEPVPEGNTEPIIGISLGLVDIVFKPEGKTVSIRPEAAKAFAQIKKDGFTNIRLMEPFAKGLMTDFPKLTVLAIKLLKDQGFNVLVSIGGSPFINGSGNTESWVYRFFPGGDPKGKDDDGGMDEHKRRMRKFMDALKAEGLLDGLRFELANEPNSERYFWGTFHEFEELLSANKEIILSPEYGVKEQDVLCCAFTSNLIKGPEYIPKEQRSYLNFVKSYKNNPVVNKLPFSFHWYPASGVNKEAYKFNSADIRLPDILKGSWITEMNVSAHMTKKKLYGDGQNQGFRSRNSFKEKTGDILEFAKRNKIAGIYIFSLLNKSDEAEEKGKIGLGLFNAKGCPRKEYKDLLEMLNRPVQCNICPE